MDLSQHDMEELRQAAEKRLTQGGIHERKMVAIDADKLLWLLDEVKRNADARAELDELHDEQKECCCVLAPPYDGCPVHE